MSDEQEMYECVLYMKEEYKNDEDYDENEASNLVYLISKNLPELISDQFSEERLYLHNTTHEKIIEAMEKLIKEDGMIYNADRVIKFGNNIEDSRKLLEFIDNYNSYLRRYFKIETIPKNSIIIIEHGYAGIEDYKILSEGKVFYNYKAISGYEMTMKQFQ